MLLSCDVTQIDHAPVVTSSTVDGRPRATTSVTVDVFYRRTDQNPEPFGPPRPAGGCPGTEPL